MWICRGCQFGNSLSNCSHLRGYIPEGYLPQYEHPVTCPQYSVSIILSIDSSPGFKPKEKKALIPDGDK